MAKAIREASGKALLCKYIASLTASGENRIDIPFSCITVTPGSDITGITNANPWLETRPLVAKPDQLIKRRGKLGLVKVNVDLAGAKEWLGTQMGREIEIGAAKGKLQNFIVEPFVPHKQEEELYVCIYANHTGNTVLFYHEGGVDVGDVDAKAEHVDVDINDTLSVEQARTLVAKAPQEKQDVLVSFLQLLYKAYNDLYFTYLEINPLVIQGNSVYMLDLAAKLDATAEFLCKRHWGDLEFPPPFGRDALPEEAYIAELDAKSGASLKLTVLNPTGRIWTMVAGGGASVIYSDTICDLGFSSELANYGEYSGAPTESQTYEYAKTLLNLMTRTKHPDGKVLIIGGGIANFTNVAATFKGIVQALTEYQHKLQECNVSIFVRRGGPNYQEGLRIMREVGSKLNLKMYVFGPETHMTAIVGMAFGLMPIPQDRLLEPASSSLMRNLSVGSVVPKSASGNSVIIPGGTGVKTMVTLWSPEQEAQQLGKHKPLFTPTTKSIVWGMQPKAVQSMLDFDQLCSRESPSVAAMVYPFSGNHKQRFYWGNKEIIIPVYKEMIEAVRKHPDVDVMINFASLRSAYDATMESLALNQFRVISIIAEGIPENLTKKMNQEAKKRGVTIIGPATVGGIKPGCFKIGNTGGMVDNLISSKLYRPGSVAYVSRSGGMSNELNNIVGNMTNGVLEGVAIGGDRYPSSTFVDHIQRFHDDPAVKMIVLLGEIGGVEEYEVCSLMKSGKLFKPMVAWCTGTCAKMFASEVQFGHAGAHADADRETADAKNKALAEAGAFVPTSFDSLGTLIQEVYSQLVAAGLVVPQPERDPPSIPMDYNWAQELGLIRKPASVMSSICDERGQELLYAGMPISDVFKEDIGIGGVLSLLWFQRRLPTYACKFMEMCLMVSADHGPAVSGAHNTIVTARAGKDLVSSLVSGLLTIGDRFGGALDGAAQMFSQAYDSGMIPMEFVNQMRKEGKLIAGIGHRVKSINNPDMRVVILRDYAKSNFPSTPLLDYALAVEKITTSKKPNLILNVDGVIATCFVDLLRYSGAFTNEEAQEYIDIGTLNGLFVLGRTIGNIGHYLDQKRLKQGLYRHPWDDIAYLPPDTNAS